MRRILILAVVAWSALVALAWLLAHWRIGLCEGQVSCIVRATATRDGVLVWGLGLALLAAITLAVGAEKSRRRYGHIGPKTRTITVRSPGRLRGVSLRWLMAAAAVTVLVGAGALWWAHRSSDPVLAELAQQPESWRAEPLHQPVPPPGYTVDETSGE